MESLREFKDEVVAAITRKFTEAGYTEDRGKEIAITYIKALEDAEVGRNNESSDEVIRKFDENKIKKSIIDSANDNTSSSEGDPPFYQR